MITLLDYGAGNVRSVRNAIKKLGFDVCDVKTAADIERAESIIFPGVGSFGFAMDRLQSMGLIEPLLTYIRADRPFMGICLGLQTMFAGSEESPGVPGLGIIPGIVSRFKLAKLSTPQIGWNGINIQQSSSPLLTGLAKNKFYFVHSYRASITPENKKFILSTTNYGDEFISGVQFGNVCAFQFHPEKSGDSGLALLNNFLTAKQSSVNSDIVGQNKPTKIAKRIVACLDVRSNDQGDLVVTKGDQYDVRDKGAVRNLGQPVDLARRYYLEGADEITFLNITGFRDFPIKDQPMLDVLKRTSEQVFVPLTIGGGVREYKDSAGKEYSALDVAAEYFRSGADKISIGSDAVYTVEQYLESGIKTGYSSIEQISQVYGAQAVVISIDPRRVFVKDPNDTTHQTIKTTTVGPNGETYCWYQCTVMGGREGRDIDAVQLAKACEELGAGELLLNCIDKDGSSSGFDLELINLVTKAVSIPVIASSGAGSPQHFSEVFQSTTAEAALAAGIFHRKEVKISEVKAEMIAHGIETRLIS